MGKYLHRFHSLEDFHENYDDSAATIVTAFTCAAGTFVYDRYDPNYFCNDGDRCGAHVWKNGNEELITNNRNTAIGNDCGNGSGAYDPTNDICIEITGIFTAERDRKYNEPWVSYTTYEANTEITGEWWFYANDPQYDENQGPCILKFKGPVKWLPTGC